MPSGAFTADPASAYRALRALRGLSLHSLGTAWGRRLPLRGQGGIPRSAITSPHGGRPRWGLPGAARSTCAAACGPCGTRGPTGAPGLLPPPTS